MGRNAGRGKVAYSWISPDSAKAGPILGVVVVDYLLLYRYEVEKIYKDILL